MTGLSQEARDLLELIRRIDSRGGGRLHPLIRRDELDGALGRPHGSEQTRLALSELDAIGDLENVTRAGGSRDPVSFTLA